ncbi:D-lactate dehydrogenase [Azorhizobium oxalatiphilum]|uniref:Quinone-dependent D-lactate dehydrogenase n=1 Tax=Azorhizobium oxalatiphilum TaxID=980631 RepID=A0A917FHX0_9HYPH|nr:D-lactate dehydrogenase [Azorhizobium oxalatiphilum]GGF78292.1 D-lactate dehydrogenase [Azorhizobium oxalatiphilum]
MASPSPLTSPSVQTHARPSNADLLSRLREAVGSSHVLTGDAQTRRFRSGFRFGTGPVLAVIRPGTLVEMWKAAKASVEAGAVVIMQAANTGLTGGSTPDGDSYDRPVVIISTLRMNKIQPILGGKQVLCFPGATLDQLERLLKPLGREPHSVIGSSCIGASVLGGVCNNSGGSLVQRGPVYTELALFGRVGEDGRLSLVNHLGVDLGNEPEQILARLDGGDYTDASVNPDAGAASDPDYARHVRDVDADTPARFNADPKRLFEASGSAGKLVVFAVRLDTFPVQAGQKVFYIGTNNADVLTRIRRDVLSGFKALPIAGEYIHREAFDIAEVYGKDVFLAICHLGAGRMPTFFSWKSRFDAFVEKFGFLPRNLGDRLLQGLSALFPSHLPKRMRDYRDAYEHHLLLKVPGEGVEEARAYLAACFKTGEGASFECTAEEGAKAFLHRFAVAGAAGRYSAVYEGKVGGILALDIALRRNERAWFEHLPAEMDAKIHKKLFYGHFLCHVLHQDYIVNAGVDPIALEHEMWDILDTRGAEYPAEHNVGHLYRAKPALLSHYRALDPCNCMNPGIGGGPKQRDGWKAEAVV